MSTIQTSVTSVTKSLQGVTLEKSTPVAILTAGQGEIQPVSNSNSAGVSKALARADHKHEGIHSIQADGGGALLGDVKIASGTGITTTTVGNTITINSSASTPSAYLHARSSTFQNIPDSSQTNVPFDIIDSASGITLDNTGIFATPSIPGYYRVTSFITFFDIGATTKTRRVLNQGPTGQVHGMSSSVATVDSLLSAYTTTCDIPVNGTTDTINISAFQNSGAPLVIGNAPSAFPSRVDIVYLHPL